MRVCARSKVGLIVGMFAALLLGAAGCERCDAYDETPPIQQTTKFAPFIIDGVVGAEVATVLEVFRHNAVASESYEVAIDVLPESPVRLVSAKQNPESASALDGATIGTEVTRVKLRPSFDGAGARVDVVFACERAGARRVTAYFADGTGRSDAYVTCTPREAGVDAGTRGVPKEFANGVGELVTVSRSGPGWIFTAGGVTTNLGQRTPELASKFSPIGDDCERFEGATAFPSEKGPDRLDAETSLQKGASTFDGMQRRYVWSGFEAGGLFGSIDSVKFGWNGLAESVPAPPPFGAPDTVLSAPAGDQTMFYVPAGEADVVTVFGQLAPGSGYTCRFPVTSLRVDVGRHAVRLVPEPVKLVIPNVMDLLQNVFVAKLNERRTNSLFPGNEHALDAARMLRIPRSALDP